MAKLTRDEFNSKWSEKISDDDLLIELMEDVSDSIVDTSEEVAELNAKIQESEKALAELKEKYKQRFLSTEEVVKADLETPVTEDEVKDVIDVKEI